jgi:hypothetical protein
MINSLHMDQAVKLTPSLRPVVAAAIWIEDQLRLFRQTGKLSGGEQIITVEFAKLLLERNAGNRSMRKEKLDQFTRDIAAGRWALNGESIIIDWDGNLLDGQHRCAAVVATGIEIRSQVVVGADPATKLTTDQGTAKGACDFLSMEGYQNSSLIAAISSLLFAYVENGTLRARGISNATKLQFYFDNREQIDAAAAVVNRLKSKSLGLISPSVLGFCYFLMAEKSAAAAEEYLDNIFVGANVPAGHPSLAVRHRLHQMGKASAPLKAEALLRGWNAVRTGRDLKVCQVLGALPVVAA